ncbi:MAG: galactokinase [Acidobacteria bacterium]|nr:galactokinase [Acidobacteriota bacterium]
MSEHPQCRRIRAACERVYGSPDLVVRGPGRINLIGEHTDAALGLVMPAAIDKGVWLALRARDDAQCRFHAADRDESFETAVATGDGAAPGWSRYLLGVYAEMSLDGRAPRGVDCVFGGDLPIGSGLSSSAALTCGLAFGLNELFALGYDRLSLAQLGQRVEHRHAGVLCGLMDQFASLLGRSGHVIRLDCRDLSHEYILCAEAGLAIVLCDSHVRRSLAADGAYNQRRAQCGEGLALLRSRHPDVWSLRDATAEMLEAARSVMNPTVFARCDYVLRENARVVDARAALESGDLERLGRLMNESHRGLQLGFEVSSSELDILTDAARRVPGVLGSRMMGAGFGGCTITLVREEALPRFEDDMTTVYRETLRAEPVLHRCRLTDGTEIVHRRA